MRAKKFSKFAKILVFWDDTTSASKWHDKEELKKIKTTLVQSLGFFLGNKKRTLMMAHSVTDDAETDYTCIPWGCIREIKEIGV